MDRTQDDLPLNPRRPPMPEMHETAEADTEFTLSTGTVLGIFFGLALLCAVFFGFGYSMGRKSASTATEASTDTSAPSASFNSFKPAPGSPAIQAVPGSLSKSATDGGSAKTSVPAYQPTAAPMSTTTTPRAQTASADVAPAPIVRTTPSAADIPVVTAPVAAPSAATGATTTYVQVAAVSHQEDADVLLSALKRRGYAVMVRNESGDSLLHVQLGPFASRKDAEAMRQRLLGDGYNAFVK